MKEKLKSITDKAKERWKKTGKKLKILLGAVLAAAIVAVVVLAITASNQPYTTLFSGLSSLRIMSGRPSVVPAVR